MTLAEDPRQKEMAGMQYALQLYQERYESMTTGITRLMEEVSSLRDVETALSKLPDSGGKRAMINAGMGFMLDAKVAEARTVTVAIGGGILAEKSVEDAKAIAAGRISAREEALKKLMSERKEIERAMYDLSARMQEMLA